MTLKFKNDAICLSGVYGTKLKSKIIHQYYDLWWQITSGGLRQNFRYPTAIIEMNAGTGEIYIEETKEIVKGSAGSALDLKFNNRHIENPNITLILVEENNDCVDHLKNVLRRRFPMASILEEGIDVNEIEQECVLIRKNVDEAIETITQMNIRGRCIYFFDPLLSTDMNPLRKIYDTYIGTPFSSGVEFLIFFFTSDWILGREDFNQLPITFNSKEWTSNEKETVNKLEDVYGDENWYKQILNSKTNEERMNLLIKEYQKRLFEMFRFVVPMPFAPKIDQLYHLIFCSNYREGAGIISRFYSRSTGNQWNPNNRLIYNRFKSIFRDRLNFPGGNRRPTEWKLLWNFIKYYQYGKFDSLSSDVQEISSNDIEKSFNWLEKENLIKISSITSYKGEEISRYELNWTTINAILNMQKPDDFRQLRNENFVSTN